MEVGGLTCFILASEKSCCSFIIIPVPYDIHIGLVIALTRRCSLIIRSFQSLIEQLICRFFFLQFFYSNRH